MSVILRAREAKTGKTITDKSIDFAVTIYAGRMVMRSHNHVYHHDHPNMYVEFGLVDGGNEVFYPICVNGQFKRWCVSDNDFTIHTMDYSSEMRLVQYPNTGWWK